MRVRPFLIVRVPLGLILVAPLAAAVLLMWILMAIVGVATAQGTVQDYAMDDAGRNATVGACRNDQMAARTSRACMNSSQANMLAVEREILGILGDRARPAAKPRRRDGRRT